ncbi:hypothetical protein ACJMK2_000831 [Sinanodonta woodiana]|uniref:C-type lectin domain-containing protein n=1 Tax=Sinanodonta woodiana TaxID=1069815 RepID=A0ABD3XQG3_SINWO
MVPNTRKTGTYYSLYAFVLFSVTVGVYAQASSRCSTWDEDLDYVNNLDTSVSLWEKNDCPLIDCAIRCNQDPSCLSYFHSPSLQICLGTQSYKRGLPSSKTIDQGWQYYTKREYCDGDYIFNQTLGLCYKLHVESKTFNDAMTACEAEGAKMMIVRNQNEMNFINTVVSSTVGAGTRLYVGVRAIGATRAWQLFNGQNGTYLPWGYGEPNNLNGNQNCVLLINGYYYDDPCDVLHPFFCQRFI